MLYASPDVLPLMKRWAALRTAYANPDTNLNPDSNLGDSLGGRPHHRNENIFRATLRRRGNYLLGGAWRSLFSDQAALVRNYRIYLSTNLPLTERDGV